MWVISAGLGLLHVSDPVVPYEATFSSMPFCHRTHWERLTTRPPAERRCTSLRALMQARPDDRFVVAASPVYLRAVETDLLAGRGELTTSEQLQVVTSKGYQGSLKDSVRYTSAGMMKGLNTNMTGLNICYALQLIGNEKLNSKKVCEVYA
ncbi:tgtA5 cluster protein 2 [Enterobacter hormaechei]|nr:tgtA5 cluster protein 2 [Enterobacter hormaechei]